MEVVMQESMLSISTTLILSTTVMYVTRVCSITKSGALILIGSKKPAIMAMQTCYCIAEKNRVTRASLAGEFLSTLP
jgi:hypothetical protein